MAGGGLGQAAFGQELGRGRLPAAGVVDRDGPAADRERVLVVVAGERVQGVTAVAQQVLALGGGLEEPDQGVADEQRADRVQPGGAVGPDGGQEGQADPELVQQPPAGLGQVGAESPELAPWQRPAVRARLL